MSFYITLPSSSSSSSSSSKKNARGSIGCSGEYRSCLQKHILIPDDDWQVALTGFQYTGQKWGHLSSAEQTLGIQHISPSKTKIVTSLKKMEEDATLNNNQSTFWIKFGTDEASYMPMENYGCSDLKQQIVDTYASATASVNKPTKLEFKDNGQIVISKNLNTVMKIQISPALVKLFSIEPEDIGSMHGYILPDLIETVHFTYKDPPSIVVPTYDIFNATSATTMTLYGVGSKGYIYNIAKGYWTPSLFAEYINSNSRPYIKIEFINRQEIIAENNDVIVSGNFVIEAIVDIANFEIQFGPHLIDLLFIHNRLKLRGNPRMKAMYNYNLTIKAVEQKPVMSKLPKTSFGSVESLCNHINQTITSMAGGQEVINFRLENGDVVKIAATQKHAYKLNIASSLLKKLGITGYLGNTTLGSNSEAVWLSFSSGEITGYSISNIQDMSVALPSTPSGLLVAKAISAFWVYTNIIVDQIVGNESVPLLRIVPNTADEGTAHMAVLDAQYIPVKNKRLSAINIKICNGSSEELVPFDSEITCVLHFMRRT